MAGLLDDPYYAVPGHEGLRKPKPKPADDRIWQERVRDTGNEWVNYLAGPHMPAVEGLLQFSDAADLQDAADNNSELYNAVSDGRWSDAAYAAPWAGVSSLAAVIPGFSAGPFDNIARRGAGLTEQSTPLQSVGIPRGAQLAGKSNSIHSIDDVRNLLAADQKVFVRWSEGPKHDMLPGAKSKDYASGQMHDGLSAVELTKDMSDQDIFKMVRDYSFLRDDKADAPYFYSGRAVGRDSDGAPSIVPNQYLGRGSDNLISFIDNDLNLERISLLDQEKYALAALNDPNYGKGPWIPAWKPQDLENIQNRLSEIGRHHPSKEGRK